MSREFHEIFARLLSRGDRAGVVPYLVRRRDAARLAIYQNNVASASIEALRAAFPVVNMLTGDRFFSPMAKAYWQSRPPRARSLTFYGDGFADLVARYEPAQSLPYLADIARLDWAALEAHHAAEAPACCPNTVAAMAPERVPGLAPGLQASVRLLRLDWPVLGVWQNHRAHAPHAPTRIAPGRTDVIVYRPQNEVLARRLSRSEAGFLRRLGEGQSLGEASIQTAASDPGFDPASAFTAALTAGYLAQIEGQEP
ncbi:DNA-binding domain-containing protein [Maricaulis sp.]|uniref:HvfC/BufC N-terminal domain-containing protein n=1 Tax=Maricaulis sp. TaxID=1486257 RepID=UPI0025B7AD62|nr:DNA-binding domain-containing protein [Maricaulis sp.]